MSYIVTNINKSRNDLENVQKLINRLSVEQQKLAISSSTLSEAEKTKLGLIMGETTAINANTIAIKAQITAEENELLQQWLSISGEKADTVATNENTAAKSANLSVTNLLRVAWAKLTDIVKAEALADVDLAGTTAGEIQNLIDENGYLGETLSG